MGCSWIMRDSGGSLAQNRWQGDLGLTAVGQDNTGGGRHFSSVNVQIDLLYYDGAIVVNLVMSDQTYLHTSSLLVVSTSCGEGNRNHLNTKNLQCL